MAEQTGKINFIGKIGEVIGYRSNGKMKLKKANEINLEALKKGANYENFRRCQSEFKTASKWCQALRKAAQRTLFNCCAQNKIRTLTIAFLKNIHSDQQNEWGKRQLQTQNISEQLENFNFGDFNTFEHCFKGKIELEIATNTFKIIAHKSSEIKAPNGATHCTFAVCIVTKSKQNYYFEIEEQREAIGKNSLQSDLTNEIILTINDPFTDIGTMKIYIIAIHFWHQKNGKWHPTENGRKNAAKIIKVING